MSNKPRICKPYLTYHVESRCIECKNMMEDSAIKGLLVDVINLAIAKYSFEMTGYTIIDDHFHFIIRTISEEDTISRIMQFIKSQFALRYNRKVKRTGPFWNERFRDNIVEDSENPDFNLLSRLLHLAFNSVRRKYVKDYRKYQYCSINTYLDRNYVSPIRITLHPYFIKLGNSFEERVKKFLEYEELYRKRLTFIYF